MKKFNIIAFAVIAFCAFGTLAAAYTENGFSLAEGQSVNGTTESLKAGSAYTFITNKTTNVNAKLGVSLCKKGLFGGFSVVERGDYWTKNVPTKTVPYSDIKKGDYRITLIHNTTGDNATISGTFYLTN